MDQTFFKTGFIFTTNAVNEAMKEFPQFAEFCMNSLERHKNQDWGDLNDEDKQINNYALLNKERVLSRYDLPANGHFPNQVKIYIITEWHRSETTILFPYEY
ncbi:hypothetical protein [Chryseobacterium sp.]|uniref:hypothetical protein n=1 Tax=Chryseobacterium sp. TaxID=1871047 RepID=UPI00289857A8|nr:hypothetical protein [Chryseobacterium sp.]